MKAYYNRIVLLVTLVVVQSGAFAAQFETLFDFTGFDSGTLSGLVRDAKGNLYGTTPGQGSHKLGNVFRLAPPAKGKTQWTQSTLFEFSGTDGDTPESALIRDAKGNLYGTTESGGATGVGKVFKLSPPSKGQITWTQTKLFEFNGANGDSPRAGVVRDAKGNLYGTTRAGGASNYGTVFMLSPPQKRQTEWKLTTLLEFDFTHGAYPVAGLIRDAKGNLYGTTEGGGIYNYGTIFRLSPPTKTQSEWLLAKLHDFKLDDGSYPYAALIRDSKGNLYGTTNQGGADNAGTVFRLAPPAKGQIEWTLTTLHQFNIVDGDSPSAGLIRDSKGNLYGTTWDGGAHNQGTVFRLAP